jgi:MFS family permease
MIDAADSERLLGKNYRARLLGVLLVANILSFADRSVFAVTSQVIKQDLKFSDFELGALQGLGFALIYALAAVPISRLAERVSRVRIISVAVAAWSLMTALTGVAGSFLGFLCARAGVGVGEAGGSAPAISLISDHYPRARRAAANSVFLLGAPAGSLVGALVGGWVSQHHGWRAAFFVLGAPGVLVALLVLLALREPPRGLADGTPPPTTPPPSLWHVFKFLVAKPTFLLALVAASLAAIGMSSVAQFMVPYLSRTYHLNVGAAARFYGWISFFSLSPGLLLGGYLGDWLAKKDERWHVWAPAIGVFAAAGFYAVAFVQTELWSTVTFLLAGGLSLFVYYAPVVAVVQNIATPRMRASAAALFGLVFSTAGPGMGPLLVGFLSDFYAQRSFQLGDFSTLCKGGVAARNAAPELVEACTAASTGGLGQAFLTELSVCFVASGVFFVLAAWRLREDLYRTQAPAPDVPGRAATTA